MYDRVLLCIKMIKTEYEKISGHFDALVELVGGLDQLCAFNIERLGEDGLGGDEEGPEKYNSLFERTENLCKYHKALNKSQERLNEIRQVMVAVAYELGVWEEEANASTHGKLITVILTDSMIRNKMLTLTDAKNSGVVSIGDKFKIEFPNGKEVTTELVGPNNRLKERGAFRDFYSEYELKAGAKLRLTLSPDTSNLWKVEILSTGIGLDVDGKSIIDFLNDV